MSSLFLLNCLSFLGYGLAFLWLCLRLQGKRPVGNGVLSRFTWFGFAGLLIHALTLKNSLFQPTGIDLGFYHALSLWGWFIGILLLVMLPFAAIENLGLVVFPLLGIGVLLDGLFASHHVMMTSSGFHMVMHVVISILAYSCLALAMAQGIMLGIQDRSLHRKRINALTQSFPPLQEMENGLFRLISAGFVLLSLSLLTGFVFVENLFAQHLIHKTVFSIVAWLVFGGLLWARWRHGLRGRLVVHWLIVGFVMLLLSYLGSKLVLEVILHH